MGHKCDCGRFFLEPLPRFCNKCHAVIPGGSFEGDSYQLVKPKSTKLELGGIINKFTKNKPIILERLPLDDIHYVEFLSDWNDDNDEDTGNLPKIRK